MQLLRLGAPLLLIAVICQSAYADAEHASDPSPGRSALLFQIAEDFDLEPFSGLSVSIMHAQSDARAYRLGASIGVREVDKPYGKDIISGDMTLQWLWFGAANRPVSPFCGVGPTIGYSGASDSTDWRGGLSFSLGAEWFARKNISIVAEYGSSLIYHYSEVEVTIYLDDDLPVIEIPPHSTRTFELIANSVRLGVSLHW